MAATAQIRDPYDHQHDPAIHENVARRPTGDSFVVCQGRSALRTMLALESTRYA